VPPLLLVLERAAEPLGVRDEVVERRQRGLVLLEIGEIFA
jgi:hypothetical protein